MHHIQRVRGIKYDLSTFSVVELVAAVGHAESVLAEQRRYLAALHEECTSRSASPRAGADAPHRQAA